MSAQSVLGKQWISGSFRQWGLPERLGLDERNVLDEPLVITGVGLITSLGSDCKSVWDAIRQGRSGVRPLMGINGIPDVLGTAGCRT